MGDAETDRLAAEFEDERPSRLLSGRIDVVVNIWCFLVALFVLKQVFWPLELGNQYYLVLFLASRFRSPSCATAPRGRHDPDDRTSAVNATPQDDNPGPLDWVVRRGRARSSASTRSCRSRRSATSAATTRSSTGRALLSTRTSWPALLLLVLVLEATRRTTGLVLPIVCLVFLAYAYYGGYLPHRLGHRARRAGLQPDRQRALQRRRAASTACRWTWPRPISCCSRSTARCWTQSGAGRFFVDLSFALFRRSRTAPGRTAATVRASCSARCPARAPRRRSAWARSPGRCCARRLPEGERRRHARRVRHRRDPVAADAGRGGVHHRRVPRRLLPDGAGLGDRADAAVLPGHRVRGRDRRPPVRRARGWSCRSASPWQLLLRGGYHFVSLGDHRGVPGAGHPAVHRGRLRDRGRRAVRAGGSAAVRRPVVDILEDEPDAEPERLSMRTRSWRTSLASSTPSPRASAARCR